MVRARKAWGGSRGRVSQRDVGHGSTAAQIERILWSPVQTWPAASPGPTDASVAITKRSPRDGEAIANPGGGRLVSQRSMPSLSGQDQALHGLSPQLPQLPPLHPWQRGRDGVVPAAPPGNPPGPGLGGLVSPLDGADQATARARRGGAAPASPPRSPARPERITQLSGKQALTTGIASLTTP